MTSPLASHDCVTTPPDTDLRQLVLDMGRVIRLLDEASEYSEFWTQDGDYVIDGRFPR